MVAVVIVVPVVVVVIVVVVNVGGFTMALYKYVFETLSEPAKTVTVYSICKTLGIFV